VRSPVCTSVALQPCTVSSVGRLAPPAALGVDVSSDRRERAGRADDDADRYIDLEDFPQQTAEGQCLQRISTEIGEGRVGCNIRGRGTE